LVEGWGDGSGGEVGDAVFADPCDREGSVVTSFSRQLVVAYSKYIPTVAGFLAAGGDEDTCLMLALQPRHVVIE
jgi:hypothetical protein